MACSWLLLFFFSSGNIPSDVILWPKNIILVLLNWHFDLLSFRPCFRIDWNAFIVCCLISSNVSPQISISSWLLTVPSMSSVIEAIRCWQISLAEWIPYSVHTNLKRPFGELNVNKFELFSSTGICQYALLASNFVNKLPVLILVNISF